MQAYQSTEAEKHFDTGTIFGELDNVQLLAIVMLNLLLLSGIGRFVARILIKKFQHDDFWISISIVLAVFAVIQFALTLVIISLSRRFWSGDQSVGALNTRVARWNGAFYYLALMATKLSLAALSRIILDHTSRPLLLAIWSLVALCLLLGGLCTGLILSSCAILKPPTKTAACAIQGYFSVLAYIYSATNATTDLVFLGSVLYLVWTLKKPRENRRLTYILFFLSGVSPAAAVTRLVLLAETIAEEEYTANIFAVIRWSIVEVSCSILASNLSVLKPLLDEFGSKLDMPLRRWWQSLSRASVDHPPLTVTRITTEIQGKGPA